MTRIITPSEIRVGDKIRRTLDFTVTEVVGRSLRAEGAATTIRSLETPSVKTIIFDGRGKTELLSREVSLPTETGSVVELRSPSGATTRMFLTDCGWMNGTGNVRSRADMERWVFERSFEMEVLL